LSIQRGRGPWRSASPDSVPKNTVFNPSLVPSSNVSTISMDSNNSSTIQMNKHQAGLRHAVSAEQLRPQLLTLFIRPNQPSSTDQTICDTSAATSREVSTNRSPYASTLPSPEHSVIMGSSGFPSAQSSAQSSKRSSAIYNLPLNSQFYNGSVNPSPNMTSTSSMVASSKIGSQRPKIGLWGGGKIITSPFEAVFPPMVELHDFRQNETENNE